MSPCDWSYTKNHPSISEVHNFVPCTSKMREAYKCLPIALSQALFYWNFLCFPCLSSIYHWTLTMEYMRCRISFQPFNLEHIEMFSRYVFVFLSLLEWCLQHAKDLSFCCQQAFWCLRLRYIAFLIWIICSIH